MIKDYIQYIVLEDECSYNNFYSYLITSSLSYLQRIRIKGLQNTSATNTQITLPAPNTNYEWLIYYTSSGVLKQHFLGYGLVNTETTKETLVEEDKVTIYDSETGEIVLTDKKNVGLSQVLTDGVTIKGNGTPDSKIELNFTGLNEADNYFVTQFEKEQIEALSPIEFSLMDVVNGVILLENPYKMYRIAVTEDTTVTMNASLVDLNKYIKFFLKVNINSNVVVSFPQNFYFANLAVPAEIGEYLYEVSTSDSGATWRAILRYKNIATVGIDTDGNQIVGAKIYYVDGTKIDNSGDGLSWATAKKDVQPAIDLANFGDAVFVKGALGAGIKYLPTTERVAGNARTKAFIMKAGVNVYGGFRGIGSSIFERPYIRYEQEMKLPSETTMMYVDLPEYRSILSGEIAGDSILVSPATPRGNQFTSASIANNSYQVVVGENMTLNGFEIIGGNANASPYLSGGGIIGSNTTLSQCYVYNNYAGSGGGAFTTNLNNCIVSNNSASIGGGVHTSSINNSIIHSNQSASNSGGANNTTANRCAVYNNYAVGSNTFGGGIGGNSVANSCVIYNNFAPISGGGFAGTSATNCAIFSNTAGRGGGGTNGGTITNCFIYNNISQSTAAASPAGVLQGTLINCAIFNNSCSNSLGVGGVGSATLINCTVLRNSTPSTTYSAGTNDCILRNTVVYGNRNGAGVKSNVVNTNSSEETYSAFEDEVRVGTGNISLSPNNTGDANSPYFKSLSSVAGVVETQFLSIPDIDNDSFLIDKGDSSLNATGIGSQYDVLFKNRLVDGIDIGAYENQKTI